jgi:5-methylthioadenosine/S-adenosylhomocysteine deaminase
MLTIDLLIDAKWILPIAPKNTVLENHSLAVHEGKIVDLLPANEAKEKYYADQFLDMNTHALMPGMVNSHTHTPMNLFRGLADDLDLMDWLTHHIWPAEGKIINPESTALGAKLAFAEMIRGGTTCFNDHYFFPDVIAKAAKEIGIRGRIGLLIMNCPTLWAKDEAQGIKACEKILETNDDFSLTEWAVAVHATYTASDHGLATAKRLSDEYNLPVHMHVHETSAELDIEKKRSGQRPLERIDHAGLLNEKFIAVHMVHLNDEDLSRVKNSGCHIILCPDSNLKLASGIPPIGKLLEITKNIAIGTDGAASNNDLDMFHEMRLAAILGKTTAGDPKRVPASRALEMATLGGAKALHLDHTIGSLEIGKSADMIAIDLDHLFTTPNFNPLSQLVYSANRLQVSDVWVAGRQLLKNFEFTRIDVQKLMMEAKPWIEQARQFSHHPTST